MKNFLIKLRIRYKMFRLQCNVVDWIKGRIFVFLSYFLPLCRILGHKLHPYRWPESTSIPFRYKIFNRCVWCGEMVEVGIDDEPELREMYFKRVIARFISKQ